MNSKLTLKLGGNLSEMEVDAVDAPLFKARLMLPQLGVAHQCL